MRKRAKIYLSSSSSSSSSQSTEDLVEESEETMVFPSENSRPSSKKSHLLKPCFTTSIDGSSSSNIKALPLSVSFHGYRLANRKLKSWTRKMSDLHKPTWEKAGILEAVTASTKRIYQNKDLVLGIAEKWCPDTKTFVFPWGETTITLEDVMVLLGFSVLGSPVFAALDSSGEKIKAKLENEWMKIKRERVMFVTQVMWMRRFVNSDDELEHVAFLVLWLSYFVFPSCNYHIPRTVIPLAIHLSRGTRLALAPAVLAHLYTELTLLKRHIRDFKEARTSDKLDLSSLFKLVQVWTWERFKELQPKPNRLVKGEPRMARWKDLKQRTSHVRQILDNSNSFEWRPYTKPLQNWDFPKFYPEEAMWVTVSPDIDDEFVSFARCIKVCELVGIDLVEHYFPNRVALQFGMRQDVAAPVNRYRLSQKEAWKEYDKPIDDLALYIPSRSETPRVTPMFCEWRRNSFQEFKSSLEENLVSESAETLRSRNVIGGGDAGFVPSGSKMKRTSYDRMKRARDKRRKYMKVESENDDEEDDDSLTVAQIIRHDNKESDVKNGGRDASVALGKKSRLEADNTDLGLPLGANGGGGGDIVVSQLETRQICDDELNVYGGNADMINDGRKKLKCLLQEDGGITRENQRLVEKFCSEAEKEDEQAPKEDKNESSPCQNPAPGGANGDGTSKAFKRKMVLSPSDELNIHIAEGDGTQRQDCSVHDDGLGNEETMKFNDAGDDSDAKRFQELKVFALSIEERILMAERKVAWLKERRAIK